MAPTDQLPPLPSFTDMTKRLENLAAFGGIPSLTTIFAPAIDPTLAKANMGLPTAPASVADPAGFESYKHQQILDGVDKIEPGTLDNAHNAVKKAADDVDHHYDTFLKAIQSAITTQWQGEAGPKAAQAITTYCSQAVQLVEGGYATASNIDTLGAALSTTKSNVPRVPDEGNWDYLTSGIGSWFGGGHHHEAELRAAEIQARQFMTQTYWGSGVQPSAANIVSMPEAKSPVSDGEGKGIGAPLSPSSPGGSGPGGSGNPARPGTDAGPNANEPQQNSPQNQNQNDGGANSGGNAKPEGSGQSSGQGGNDTRASSADPSGLGSDSLGGLGSGGGAGAGGGGLGSGGGEGAGNDPLAAPLLGGGSTGANAGAGRGGAMAGRAGAPGMGGMPAGGAKRKGEDDKTHKTKEYPGLYGSHNLDEWFETIDGRKVSPPVLGVWPVDEAAGDENPSDDKNS